MSITANGATSLKKEDLASQKTPLTGFKKVVFAHRSVGGESSIPLSALVLPPEMPGFVNPNVSEISAANIIFYRKNLTLVSSLRGVLIDYMSYTVAGNLVINFTDSFGTTLPGEVFIGTIDGSVASNGVQVVDGTVIGATGSLLATATDFNVGQQFTVNKYPSRQFGEVMVFLDGVIQYRNTGNSSTVLDGNYYEVDSGNGSGTLIRFNMADPINARAVIVAGTGLMSYSSNGSTQQVIDSLAGQIDRMSAVVAALSGLPVNQITGAAPNNLDLKTFGDRVIAIDARLVAAEASVALILPQMILANTTTRGFVKPGVQGITTGSNLFFSAQGSLAVSATISQNLTPLTSGYQLLTITFSARYSNGNGTPLTPRISFDIKDGALTLDNRQYAWAVASGFNDIVTFSFTTIVPTLVNASVYTCIVTNSQNDGGSHSYSNILYTGNLAKVAF